jgi:hypothetical protein
MGRRRRGVPVINSAIRLWDQLRALSHWKKKTLSLLAFPNPWGALVMVAHLFPAPQEKPHERKNSFSSPHPHFSSGLAALRSPAAGGREPVGTAVAAPTDQVPSSPLSPSSFFFFSFLLSHSELCARSRSKGTAGRGGEGRDGGVGRRARLKGAAPPPLPSPPLLPSAPSPPPSCRLRSQNQTPYKLSHCLFLVPNKKAVAAGRGLTLPQTALLSLTQFSHSHSIVSLSISFSRRSIIQFSHLVCRSVVVAVVLSLLLSF